MTAMQFVEILSAALGLLGAALLASKSRFAGWAFVAWLVSNIGWIVFGAGNQHWFFIAQQVGFAATSVLGIWNWLVRPASQPLFKSIPQGLARPIVPRHGRRPAQRP